MTEIHPKNCLTRICRFCKNHMTLVDYEFDLEDRIFAFFCNTCEHGTVLLEQLSDDDYFANVGYGVKHEPLTSEELKEVEDEDDTTPIATVTSEDGEIYVDFSEEFKEKNR